MHKEDRYAIIGGGIGGLTLAIALQRKGFQNVKVFEGAPAWKPLGAGLGLAGNAIKAFREIGIDGDILKAGNVIRKVKIRNAAGKVLAMTDSEEVSRRFGVVNNFTIHRADLHEVLLKNVAPGTVVLGKSCVDFVQNADGIGIRFADGTTEQADYVIACDGVHSVIRRKLVRNSEPRYAGYTCWRAITDEVPSSLDMEETSESWGKGARFGIVPLKDGRVYMFACVNAPANDNLMKSLSAQDLLAFFGKFHQPIPDLLKRTPNDRIIWNDIIDIAPLSKFAFGRIVLMGDAAHATTPNMGQGACMAIEDAVVLASSLERSATPEEAFVAFEQKRIKRTTKIVNDSWQLGRVAQLENPVAAKLRDWAIRSIPERIADKQFKFIYDVSLH